MFRWLSYSDRQRTLTAEFASGARYRYDDVPPTVARELFATDSAGRFFNRFIKATYTTWKLV